MSSSLKRNECKRQCRYEYSKEERAEKGRNLADELGAMQAVEAELERIKKDYKARIDARAATIDNLSEQVRSGYELRETLCFWTYNEPKPGRKTLRRADTLEVIGEEDMTGADTQTVMEELDAAAADKGGDFPSSTVITITETSTTPLRRARRVSSSGVVGTDSDGEDLSNPDDSKAP